MSNFLDVVDGNVLLSAFDVADVVAMQISILRKLLLRPAPFFSESTYVFAEQPPRSQVLHALMIGGLILSVYPR
jgi:hypothetical protein